MVKKNPEVYLHMDWSGMVSSVPCMWTDDFFTNTIRLSDFRFRNMEYAHQRNDENNHFFLKQDLELMSGPTLDASTSRLIVTGRQWRQESLTTNIWYLTGETKKVFLWWSFEIFTLKSQSEKNNWIILTAMNNWNKTKQKDDLYLCLSQISLNLMYLRIFQTWICPCLMAFARSCQNSTDV